MKYNFDELYDRKGSYSLKYDGAAKYIKTSDKDILPLWVADMDFKVAPCIAKAMQKRANHEIYGYTIFPNEINTMIKNWLFNNFQWQIISKSLDYPPGILVGIATAVLAFTRSGDKIIVQKPAYFPYFSLIENLSRQLVNNELLEKNLHYYFDYADLEKKVADGGKILILCNPQNPVGRVWTRKELEEVAKIAKKYNILVISDEAHADLAFAPYKHIPFATIDNYTAKNTITMMALSKGFNVAGLYCAYTIIQNPNVQNQYQKWLKGLMVTHGRNAFSDQAFLAAYTNKGKEWLLQVKEYIYGNISFVENFLKNNIPNIKMPVQEATYLIWLDFRKLGLTQEKLIEFLTQKAKVGLHSGTIFGESFKGFMRMNVAHPKVIIKEAMERIQKAYFSLISYKN